jgi:hypothetical protein
MASKFGTIHPAYNAVKYNGNFHEIFTLLTIGATDTYATGGITVNPSDLQVNTIVNIEPVLFSTGHWGVWVAGSPGKIKVFSAAGTELVNASAALQNATAVIKGQGQGI